MQILLNIFLLTGTVIGAGIFSLPSVFSKLGSIFYILLLILGFLTAYMGVKYYQLIKTVGKQKQMPTYIKESLGKFWGKTALVLFASSLAGALISYLLLIKEQIGDIFFFLALNWGLLSLNPKLLRRFDGLLTIALISSIIMLILQNQQASLLPEFPAIETLNLEDIAKSYGVVLFSFTGFSIIPDLLPKGKVKLSIFISYIIIGLIYLYFGNFVKLNQSMLMQVVIFFAVTTSYVPLSFVLEETLNKDLGLKKLLSKTTSLFIPVAVVALNMTDFISALSITGGIFISFLQILIISAYIKKIGAKTKIEKILLYATIFIFFAGALSELYFLF